MRERPRIICLMTSSLDGRLHPSRWTRSPDGSIKDWSASFEAYHDDLKADAWLVGRTTMAEMAKGVPHLPEESGTPPRPIHVAKRKAPFAIAIDRSGKLHFAKPDIGGEGWAHGALAFTVFAAALIMTRIVGSHLPDRFYSGRVALVCLFAQAAGLVGVGIAPSGPIAMAGAAFAGAGFSLVFPSLGLEAVRRAPAGNRGLAMGTYNAFLDLTLGLGSPALGYLADREGLAAVFLASALAAILAVPIAILLTKTPPPHPA